MKKITALLCAFSLSLGFIPVKTNATNTDINQAYYNVIMDIVNEYGCMQKTQVNLELLHVDLLMQS